MNLQAGLPYSLIQNGLMFFYPKLDTDIQTEVLIVGGGISGALTSYWLTKAGIQTTVIDSRTIGLGSTCASTSLLQYEIDTPLVRLAAAIGKKEAATAYVQCCESIHQLHDLCKEIRFSDFKLNKSLFFAATRSDVKWLQEEERSRRHIGLLTRWLDADDIEAHYGFKCHGGILSATAAYTDAYKLTHALHQASMNKGSLVFDRTRASGFDFRKRSVQCRTSDGMTIRAKAVVFATGYEIAEQIKKKIVDLHSTYATVSDPMFGKAPLLDHDLLVWNTADPYLYLRGTSEGRVIIGGRDENFFDPVRRNKLIKAKEKALVRDYQRMFPGHPFEAEFSWTGTFGTTKDGLPYIGRYQSVSNRYFALGFGGNGITFSVIAARVIRDLIQGKSHRSDKLYRFDR